MVGKTDRRLYGPTCPGKHKHFRNFHAAFFRIHRAVMRQILTVRPIPATKIGAITIRYTAMARNQNFFYNGWDYAIGGVES